MGLGWKSEVLVWCYWGHMIRISDFIFLGFAFSALRGMEGWGRRRNRLRYILLSQGCATCSRYCLFRFKIIPKQVIHSHFKYEKTPTDSQSQPFLQYSENILTTRKHGYEFLTGFGLPHFLRSVTHVCPLRWTDDKSGVWSCQIT